MKKKILKILTLITIFALTVLTVIPAFAAKTVNVKLDVAGENGKVYVRLTAPVNSDISTMSATLKFDTSKLTFNRVTYIADPTIISVTDDKSAASGLVNANIIIADSLYAESKIFTYVFDVKEGAEGEVSFEFTSTEATDSNNDKLNIAFNGDKSAVISDLKPLTPDVTQPDFTAPPTTVKEPESTDKNKDNPKIPPTSGRIAAISAVGIAAVAAIAGGAVYASKKKKDNE